MAKATYNQVKEAIEQQSKYEVLLSYSDTFDSITGNMNKAIQNLKHHKEALGKLTKQINTGVKAAFSDPKKVMEKIEKDTVKKSQHGENINYTKRAKRITELLEKPETFGKLKDGGKQAIDMMKTQKISMDFEHQASRRRKDGEELGKERKALGSHTEKVWNTAQKFNLDNEYNEFVRAKTPKEKMESRLVKGYEEALKDTTNLLKNTDAATLEKLEKEGVNIKMKQQDHPAYKQLKNKQSRETKQQKTKKVKKVA